MPRVDRRRAHDARFVLEGLIPDAANRERWLGLLADAIEHADHVHRGSWGVTLFDDGLRLNVGTIETVVFGRGGAMLVLDAAAFSDDEIAEIRLNPALGTVDLYTSVPGTVNVTVPYDLDGIAHDEARTALLSLVERAAARVKTRTGYNGSHSPGVVQYLADVTHRPLRQPTY